MKRKHTVSFFDSLVYRRPIHNIGAYFLIPKIKEEVSDFVYQLYENLDFRKSIYIASPELYDQWIKIYNKNINLDKNRIAKIECNIVKYYIRSIFNCSPFGLFSGYSILSKGRDKQSYEQIQYINHSYIQTMINEINEIQKFRILFKYNLNNTVYKIGNSFRYMEYNTRKSCYELSKIKIDPVINYIYEKIKFPISIDDMAKLLFQKVEGVSYEDIIAYINSLIDSQFLISDFQILTNGKNPTTQFEELVKKWEVIENYLISKYNINLLYGISNKNIPNKDFIAVSQKIKNKFVQSDILKRQSVININLKIETDLNYESTIEKDKNAILKLVNCLSKFTSKSPDSFYISEANIKMFIDEFQQHYEEQELPLVEVLDPEIGIGYLNNDTLSRDIIPDLIYTRDNFNTNIEKITFDNKKDCFLIKKITDALLDGNRIITINDEDLSILDKEEHLYRGTYALIYTKINDKIVFFAGGGGTAQHYIGRFTAYDNDLLKLSSSITSFENYLFKDRIVAEIIHLSNDECGNIINRNIKRDYEIPIYSPHSKEVHPIYLTDIMLSVREGKMVLRSKKYNKEIIPFLSCAHNFHYETAPIYKFLCDIQCLYRSNILSFEITSVVKKNFKYIPRFEYENSIVLSPATWLFYKEDLKECLSLEGDILIDEFKKFIKRYNIPRFVDLIENSYSFLPIDLENNYLFGIVNQSFRKFNQLYFQENLYLNELPNKNAYANQIVLSLYKDNPLPSKIVMPRVFKTKRSFVPGDEWLYFKLYCHCDFSTTVISALYKTIKILYKNNLIDKWFFIKLYDPNFHIRLRIHITSISNIHKVFSLVNQKTSSFVKFGQISNISLDTYKRELERYYDANITSVESIFWIDSEFVVKVFDKIRVKNDWKSLWLYGLKGIDSYLDSFGFNIHQKLLFVSECYESYSGEFKTNKLTKKQIDTLFREQYNYIYAFFKLNDKEVNKLFTHKDNSLRVHIKEIKSCLDEKQISNLVRSINHMFINRLFITKQRLNEMVLYGILTKFYKKELWIVK